VEACSCYDDLGVAVVVVVAEMVLPSTCATTSCRVVVAGGHILTAVCMMVMWICSDGVGMMTTATTTVTCNPPDDVTDERDCFCHFIID
jgi:hypothetical protein